MNGPGVRSALVVLLALELLQGCGSPAPAASLRWLAPQPLPPHALQQLLQRRPECRLATPTALLAWVRQQQDRGTRLPKGLYWVQAEHAAEAAFALYVLLPAEQVVEYGNLVFDAHAVAVCDRRETSGNPPDDPS